MVTEVSIHLQLLSCLAYLDHIHTPLRKLERMFVNEQLRNLKIKQPEI